MNNGDSYYNGNAKYFYCTNPTPRRHDASKCLDYKCCDRSFRTSGRCDKEFRQVKGYKCPYGSGSAYFCLPPFRPRNHNKKKCLVNGKKDKDCCVSLTTSNEPSCSGGYQVKQTHEACSSRNKKEVRFYCLPPTPPDDHNPKKCLQNKKFDNNCCARKKEGSCRTDYKFV